MAPPRTPVMDRIERRLLLDLGTGCWLYQGSQNSAGYPVVSAGGHQGPMGLVHRVVYENLVERIPDGLVLDHLCRRPACCNPGHLEPVTNRENSRRGLRGELYTQCPKGHDLTPSNTLIVNKGGGRTSRRCKTCRTAELRRSGHNPAWGPSWS